MMDWDQPNAHWCWIESEGRLHLTGPQFHHATPFPAVTGYQKPFCLADVEAFQQFRPILESYFHEQTSSFAATVDAVAAAWQAAPACRGFWFDYLRAQAVQTTDLAKLKGQHITTCIVISTNEFNAVVLLLEPVTTLQDKVLPAGQLVHVPLNRLARIVQSTPQRFAQSA